MNCGLKAFRAEVARELDLYGELHRFIPVLAHDLGFRVTEISASTTARASTAAAATAWSGTCAGSSTCSPSRS